GDVVSWHWYINNDLFSDSGPETDVIVDEPGEYQICLVIETAAGCVDTFCHGVMVEAPQGDCEAHFTWNVEGYTIFLNGSSSAGGDVVSWHWYINNDLFSDSGPETDVIVDEPGEYQICLVIETAAGCVDTFCHGVMVEAPQGDCEAHFTWNVEGYTIFLNGSSSAGGDVVSWHWYINNDLFSDSGPETDAVVDEPGEYQICLVIETNAGCADTSCYQVIIEGLLNQQNNLKILPPGEDESLNLIVTAAVTGSIQISIFEMTGRQIFTHQESVQSGTMQYVIPFNKRLSTGIYLISVQFNDSAVITGKFAFLN
ncbi:MAG: T9SS type A sorting domain-containing protein, partial [Chitinophagales bacterium]|nr:T9SS type A sorting domain-containing protein [Chitinophagales bacterium]